MSTWLEAGCRIGISVMDTLSAHGANVLLSNNAFYTHIILAEQAVACTSWISLLSYVTGFYDLRIFHPYNGVPDDGISQNRNAAPHESAFVQIM